MCGDFKSTKGITYFVIRVGPELGACAAAKGGGRAADIMSEGMSPDLLFFFMAERETVGEEAGGTGGGGKLGIP